MKNKFKNFFVFVVLMSVLHYQTISYINTRAEESSTSVPRYVVPGGEVMGIKLYTDGVYIVGITYVDTNEGRVFPGRDANLRIGDYITKIDDSPVSAIEDVSENIKSSESLMLEVIRNGKKQNIKISPALQAKTGEYKIGLWIKDSTAGIGTVTFYDSKNKIFGALGHGIADADTGQILRIKKGFVYDAYITSITKSERGTPGELRGNFKHQDIEDGVLLLNTDKGVFGKCSNIYKNEMLETANADEVVLGEAVIRSTIAGNELKEYKVNIVKISLGNAVLNRGMVIEVTDEELIRKTGGIVQGMSGSPIIQNNKIIGSVTHVFVNNPHKGYAIFIEDMLTEMEKTKTP